MLTGKKFPYLKHKFLDSEENFSLVIQKRISQFVCLCVKYINIYMCAKYINVYVCKIYKYIYVCG